MVRSYRSRTSSVPSVTHYTLRKRRCGEPTSLYITQHTYAFQSIQSIVASHPNYDDDVSDLTSVDDVWNVPQIFSSHLCINCATQPDTTPATILSHSLKNNKQQGSATPCAESSLADITESLPTTRTPAPLSAFDPHVLNKSFATDDASPAAISKSLLPASSVDVSNPDSLYPHISPP